MNQITMQQSKPQKQLYKHTSSLEKPKAPVRNVRTGAKQRKYVSTYKFYFPPIPFLQSKLFPFVTSFLLVEIVYVPPFQRCSVASFLRLSIAPTVTILYSARAF